MEQGFQNIPLQKYHTGWSLRKKVVKAAIYVIFILLLLTSLNVDTSCIHLFLFEASSEMFTRFPPLIWTMCPWSLNTDDVCGLGYSSVI